MAFLLRALRAAGATGQVTTLACRAAADASLDDPAAVARLLDRLREVGAAGQVAALLARDPAAHTSLDDPAAVARLLDALRAAGAGAYALGLIERLPEAGMFQLFREQEGGGEQFRFGREADGGPPSDGPGQTSAELTSTRDDGAPSDHEPGLFTPPASPAPPPIAAGGPQRRSELGAIAVVLGGT